MKKAELLIDEEWVDVSPYDVYRYDGKNSISLQVLLETSYEKIPSTDWYLLENGPYTLRLQ